MRYFLSCLFAFLLLQGQVMADQIIKTEETATQEYKKLPIQYFSFTPTKNGGYRLAIMLDRDKAKNAVGNRNGLDFMNINKKILKGNIYIYKQPQNGNRSELIETVDVQKMKVDYGDLFIGDKAPAMLQQAFIIDDLDPKYYDRYFYTFVVELESLVDDLGPVGIAVSPQPRTPIM